MFDPLIIYWSDTFFKWLSDPKIWALALLKIVWRLLLWNHGTVHIGCGSSTLSNVVGLNGHVTSTNITKVETESSFMVLDVQYKIFIATVHCYYEFTFVERAQSQRYIIQDQLLHNGMPCIQNGFPLPFNHCYNRKLTLKNVNVNVMLSILQSCIHWTGAWSNWTKTFRSSERILQCERKPVIMRPVNSWGCEVLV